MLVGGPVDIEHSYLGLSGPFFAWDMDVCIWLGDRFHLRMEAKVPIEFYHKID